MQQLSQQDAAIIDQAIAIISNLFKKENLSATNPALVKKFCQLQLAHLEHEVFGVLFLDNQHRLIKFTAMFRGTLAESPVYPREVAKESLFCNAAALILCHNHPSGIAEPSNADKRITAVLVEALKLFDVRVLDHIVVSHLATTSFAERGLL